MLGLNDSLDGPTRPPKILIYHYHLIILINLHIKSIKYIKSGSYSHWKKKLNGSWRWLWERQSQDSMSLVENEINYFKSLIKWLFYWVWVMLMIAKTTEKCCAIGLGGYLNREGYSLNEQGNMFLGFPLPINFFICTHYCI